MKTLAVFNNKGGVGKTTLVYHLAHMLSSLGLHVLTMDLDPQANLTSAFLKEEILEALWDEEDGKRTILGCVKPILDGIGDISERPYALTVGEKLSLVPGDLGLSLFEDKLSHSWNLGFAADAAAFRATTAFYRTMVNASQIVKADLVLLDLGPNLGAINRSALLCADFLAVPLSADLFSLQGLRNIGPTLKRWKNEWTEMKNKAPRELPLPPGTMHPIGYVVLQHEVRLNRPVKAFEKWVKRIPIDYANYLLDEQVKKGQLEDKHCLSSLRNFRSLMPMAQDARKPMFELKSADGAIGSHAHLVSRCHSDFKRLASRLTEIILPKGSLSAEI